MEYFNTLMKKEKQHEMVLFVVLVIYIMLDVSTPRMLAEHVDTVYGTVIVAILALSLFLSTHPVVGILGLFAAYEFIQRSKSASAGGPGSGSGRASDSLLHRVSPGETYRAKYMEATQTEYNAHLESGMADQVPILSAQAPSNYRDANSRFQPTFTSTQYGMSEF
jgi:hypothetical protein